VQDRESSPAKGGKRKEGKVRRGEGGRKGRKRVQDERKVEGSMSRSWSLKFGLGVGVQVL